MADTFTQRERLTDRFGRKWSWTGRWERRRLRREVSGRRFRRIQWWKSGRTRIGVRRLTRSRVVRCRASEALRHVCWWGWLARSRSWKWCRRLPGWITDIRWSVNRWWPLRSVTRYFVLLRICGRLKGSRFFGRSLGAVGRQVRIWFWLLANCKNTWPRRE